MLTIAILVHAFVGIAVGTVVLTVALTVTGAAEVSKDTILKCLSIAVATALVSLIPVIGLLSIVVWFAMIMSTFELNFLEAFLVALVCWAVNLGVIFALTALL